MIATAVVLAEDKYKIRSGSCFMKGFSSATRWLALSLCLALAACGGGGGENEDGSKEDLKLGADKSTVEVRYEEGQIGTPAIVRFTVTGSYGGQVYAGVVVTGNGVRQDIALSPVSDTVADMAIVPANGLAAGEYTGVVSVYLCYDYECNRPVSGAPRQIEYRIVVEPHLANPSALNFQGTVGQSSVTRTIQISLPAGVSKYTAYISSGISVFEVVSQTNTELVVRTTQGLGAAVYMGELTIIAGAKLVVVPMLLQVS